MFERISKKLAAALESLKGSRSFTAENVAPPLEAIKKALLEADVTYAVTKKLLKEIKQKIVGKPIALGLTARQWLTKQVYTELVQIMGGQPAALQLKGAPSVVLVAGLQGVGKTTFVAKLGYKFAQAKRPTLLIAADLQRPGAVDQLRTLAAQAGLDFYESSETTDPLARVLAGLAHAKAKHYHRVIIDSAGRKSVDEELMAALKQIQVQAKAQETLLVLDGMMGKSSLETAENFRRTLPLTGLVLTKMDGDTRGGVALSATEQLGVPITHVSYGEKIHQLEVFSPERMARRILGMGDILSLVEEAEAAAKIAEKKTLQRKISKKEFDYDLMALQIKQLQQMGDMSSLLSRLPSHINRQIDASQERFHELQQMQVMVDSMTPWERTHPSQFHKNISRKQRVAHGAGLSMVQLQRLIKSFEKIREQMKAARRNPGLMQGLFG